MHPVFFLPRGHSATKVSVNFVKSRPMARFCAEAGSMRRRACFANAGAGLRNPKAGRHLLLAAADGALAGVLFASRPGRRSKDCLFGRVRWRPLCRRAA